MATHIDEHMSELFGIIDLMALGLLELESNLVTTRRFVSIYLSLDSLPPEETYVKIDITGPISIFGFVYLDFNLFTLHTQANPLTDLFRRSNRPRSKGTGRIRSVDWLSEPGSNVCDIDDATH